MFLIVFEKETKDICLEKKEATNMNFERAINY
jgi:hypothetical protein